MTPLPPANPPGAVTGALNSGYVPEDARSHISQFSTRSRARSDARSEHGLFGQSQRYPSRNGELGPIIVQCVLDRDGR